MNKRKVETVDLAQAFDDAENEFGDHKSTEFLVQIVCDQHGVEPEDVYDALAAAAEADEIKDEGENADE